MEWKGLADVHYLGLSTIMPLNSYIPCMNITQETNEIEFIIHLMVAPEGNSEFCFPESLNVSRDEVEETLRPRGKQNSLFPEGVHIKCFVI